MPAGHDFHFPRGQMSGRNLPLILLGFSGRRTRPDTAYFHPVSGLTWTGGGYDPRPLRNAPRSAARSIPRGGVHVRRRLAW
jgi:hypothetical protein